MNAIKFVTTLACVGVLCVPISGYAQDKPVQAGWNLLGNGDSSPLNVKQTFQNPTDVVSVWKWVREKATWAFYSPLTSDDGIAFATSKGYEPLITITSGEGF